MTASRPVGECDGVGCDHYACGLRSKGLNVSPRLQTTRTQNWRPTPSIPPARNGEILYDHRPDGSKSPLLKPDGTPLRGKQYDDNRHHWDKVIRERRTPATTA